MFSNYENCSVLFFFQTGSPFLYSKTLSFWYSNFGAFWQIKYNFVVQSLSCVRLFVTPWTAALQASLSITISWSLLKLMSIESMMSSKHLILCLPLLLLLLIFPSIRVFSNVSFVSGGQSIRVSASTSVLPITIQDWFPLGLTGLIFLLSKGLSRVFFSTTV